MEYLILLLIGILSGAASGLLGIGGGAVAIPLLLYLTNTGIKEATAISMIQIFFASSFGTLFNYLQKNIIVRIAVIFGLASMSFSFLGSYLTRYIPDNIIKIAYLCAVVTSIAMFFLRKKTENDDGSINEKNQGINKSIFLKTIPLGAIAGFIGGLLGMGGGFLYVPILLYFFGLPVPVAVGTSLMIVLFNSIPGVIGKVLSVDFNYISGILVGAGAIAGARIGTYLNKRLKPIVIKVIFVVVLVTIVIRVLIDLLS